MALKLKQFEKVFVTKKNIQRMLNVDNAEEAYVQQAHFIMQRIEDRHQ